jgi:hypothetical protein
MYWFLLPSLEDVVAFLEIYYMGAADLVASSGSVTTTLQYSAEVRPGLRKR